MHIFLNPPNMFWSIEGTDIRLTRGAPFFELTEDDINKLQPEQKAIIKKSLLAQTITEINPDFIPKAQGANTIDFVLTRRASEIQRKYVRAMVVAGDVNSLKLLLAGEQEKENPRADVIEVINRGLAKLSEEQGGVFKAKIEEIEDDLGGTLDLALEDPIEVSAKRRTRTRRKRV